MWTCICWASRPTIDRPDSDGRLSLFRGKRKHAVAIVTDSRGCSRLLGDSTADSRCSRLQKKRLMSLPRSKPPTQPDDRPPPRASGLPAQLPPAEKLPACSQWSESASECTREPRRRKTWAQQVCCPLRVSHTSHTGHVQPVLSLSRPRPGNPDDGHHHCPRSRHHVWILLQEVLIDTAPN